MKNIDPVIHQAEINYKNDYFNPKNPHPGETLLKTIDFCFHAKIPIPEWVQVEYQRCYKKYQQRMGSNPLVNAFDTDPDAGKQRAKQHRKQQHINTICHTLWHLHEDHGLAIDEGLFEEVAKRHGNIKGLSASTIEKEYYPMVKQFVSLFGGFVICPDFVMPPKI